MRRLGYEQIGFLKLGVLVLVAKYIRIQYLGPLCGISFAGPPSPRHALFYVVTQTHAQNLGSCVDRRSSQAELQPITCKVSRKESLWIFDSFRT